MDRIEKQAVPLPICRTSGEFGTASVPVKIDTIQPEVISLFTNFMQEAILRLETMNSVLVEIKGAIEDLELEVNFPPGQGGGGGNPH